MPTYCYRTKDGALHEVTLSDTERRRREKKGRMKLPNGKIGVRDIAAEHGGFRDLSEKNFPKGGKQDHWAVAVHPSQVAEADAKASALGVPTEHNREGSPQFTSAQHRAKYLRKFGFVDRSAYC